MQQIQEYQDESLKEGMEARRRPWPWPSPSEGEDALATAGETPALQSPAVNTD